MYSLSFGGISIRRNGAPTMPTPQWPYRAYPFLILNYALLNSSQARPNFHAGPRLTRESSCASGRHAHAIEEIVAVRRVRTPHDRPACAVPMFNYGAVSVELRVEGPSDCPNIIIRHSCHGR